MGQVLAYYLFLYKLAKNDLNIFKWLKIVICNNWKLYKIQVTVPTVKLKENSCTHLCTVYDCFVL